MERIILASGSPRRQWLLRQIGLEPEVAVSQVEEVMTDKEPDWTVCNLALRKAEDVAARVGIGDAVVPAVVIGADTVVAVDGRILGKPASVCEAEHMIELLQGRSHQVFTGVAMIFGNTGEKVVFAEKTDVHVYPMSREQIVGYVLPGSLWTRQAVMGFRVILPPTFRGLRGTTTMW